MEGEVASKEMGSHWRWQFSFSSAGLGLDRGPQLWAQALPPAEISMTTSTHHAVPQSPLIPILC